MLVEKVSCTDAVQVKDDPAFSLTACSGIQKSPKRELGEGGFCAVSAAHCYMISVQRGRGSLERSGRIWAAQEHTTAVLKVNNGFKGASLCAKSIVVLMLGV